MAFDKLMETLNKEIAEEMSLREEIIYKKGFAAGIEEAKSKCKCQRESSAEEEALDEAYAEGYLDGIEDFKKIISIILDLSWSVREALFGYSRLSAILDEVDTLDIVKTVYSEFIDIKIKEEDNLIGDILDSTLSDDLKRLLLQAIDDGIEVKFVK
jgi:cation transport regulator ChaB